MRKQRLGVMPKIYIFTTILLCLSVCTFAAPLTIYDQANLGGTGSDVQTYTVYAGTGIPGGLNNLISSFQLDQGYMAVVADPSDGVGVSKTYIANDGPLTITLPAELDNNISFIRVVPWENVVKKGFCGDLLVQPDWLDVGSYYRWWVQELEGSGQPVSNPQYIPMAYGGDSYWQGTIDTLLAMDQVSHVLGLNEPDNTIAAGGTEVYVYQAINLFPNLQKTGLRMGSPACTEGEALGLTTQWLPNFMQQADAANIRVDYIGVHWYDWGSSPAANPDNPASSVFANFKNYLGQVYAQYRRPIWITEFNANLNRSTAIQDEFLQLALPYLETLGYVERYMYFQPFGAHYGDFFDANDQLTSTGQIYKDQVSSPSYTSKTLPTPWQDQDIGAVAAAGDTIYANGNFTVCGGGVGITGTADEFRYVYQLLAGDGEIVARVNSLVWRHNLSMGGVMVRETLDAGSSHASMFISQSDGARFQYRSTTGGTSGSSTQAGIKTPHWVKMVRQGDTLTGYYSQDGLSWTQVGSQIISMSETVYIGLAACSYNDGLTAAGFGKFCDAVITDVSVQGNTPPVFISDPISKPDATESTSYSDTISGSATDADSDPLYFSAISGPAWLAVASGGALSGTPGTLDVGANSWIVQVSDGNGGADTTALNISVLATGGGGGDPVTLVGGSLLNGDFNANPGESIKFVDTMNWYNLQGDQDAVNATDDDLAEHDGSQNAFVRNPAEAILAVDTEYAMAEGDIFDISYVWRDAAQWDDSSDQVRVALFMTDDNTLTGVRTDLIVNLSETSAVNITYEAVDLPGIYTAVAGDAGKTLFVAIDSTSTGLARLDDFELIVTPSAPANNAPVFTVDPINEANATEDVAYAGSVANATDADSDPLTYSKVSGSAWLSVAADGSLSGTPANGDVGANAFTVQVSDGNGGTDTATLNITVDNVNDAPVFTVDPINEANATEDVAYAGSVANATDADSDPLTYSKVSGAAWLSVAADGSLSGTPANGDVGANAFTVQVSDGNGGTDTATLNITVDVAPVNQPPAFTADPFSEANATENAAYSGSIAADASDPESDPLTFSKAGGPAWLSVASDGTLSGTPGATDIGLNSFTVQVDAIGGSDTATLNITVDEESVPLPGEATNLVPVNRARDVSTTPTLSWTAGSDAVSHDVYLGTDAENLVFQGNQTGTTFSPGTLANKIRYYWRIDEVNAAGTTTGTALYFTTVR